MSTGFYAAASGALMQQRVLNALGNNVANAQTPGFRTERVTSNIFAHELMVRQERGNHFIGSMSPVRIVQDVPTDFGSGSYKETDRPYDLALNSEGFFHVTTGAGETYLTRNGNFDIDAEGFLILRGAGRVQGEQGDIPLPDANFKVDADGTITDLTKGKIVDKLLISAPDEGTQLTHTRDGLYKIDPAPMDTPASILSRKQTEEQGAPEAPTEKVGALHTVEQPKLIQNSLETSNIDFNREMSLLIESQRNFQSCSQMMKTIDQIDQRTAKIAEL